MAKINAKELEKQLKARDIVLFVLSKEDYSEEITGLAKLVAEQNKSICYVSANKPATVLIKLFAASGIDTKKFWFVDCISRSAFGEDSGKNEQKDSVILFTNSPRDLTELSINISGAISNGVTSVFVDALSTFLIYEEGIAVLRFAHNVISKLREHGCRGFFVVLKSDIASTLLDDLSMFVDKVITI